MVSEKIKIKMEQKEHIINSDFIMRFLAVIFFYFLIKYRFVLKLYDTDIYILRENTRYILGFTLQCRRSNTSIVATILRFR